MENGTAYEGTIIKRIYEETYNYADYNYGTTSDSISKGNSYIISGKSGSTQFEEWQFGTKVYTDKQKFINDKLIIK